MQNFFTKTLAVSTVSGLMLRGGAGMASADTGDVAGNNNVLNGIDTDVTDNLNGILSGNNTDVNANPDVDSTVDADSTTDNSEDERRTVGRTALKQLQTDPQETVWHPPHQGRVPHPSERPLSQLSYVVCLQ